MVGSYGTPDIEKDEVETIVSARLVDTGKVSRKVFSNISSSSIFKVVLRILRIYCFKS